MSIRKLFFPWLICLVLAGTRDAPADDIFIPDWRGEPGTLTAGWGFWGQPGPGPGQIVLTEAQLIQANPGGFQSTFPAWAHWNSNVIVRNDLLPLWGRPSVLEIGPDSNPGILSFGFENYDAQRPVKDLLAQTPHFRQGFGAPMRFSVGAYPSDPGTFPWPLDDSRAATVISSFDHGDGWQTNVYGIRLEPNPLFESFAIDFTQYPAFVAQVVVDTRCYDPAEEVPEPDDILLWALGISIIWLAWGWRRGATPSSHPRGR